MFLAAVMLATTAAAPGQDTLSSPGVTAVPSWVRAIETPDVPFSLERIRELLGRPAPLQQTLLKRPTFKVEVEERRPIQDMISTLDFQATKPGPVPRGGIYNYETQRVMMSSVSAGPMMQPYAAFNGGELLTLAFEGLLSKYLGMRAVGAVTAADRERAASAARAEVSRAIVQYCDGLPNKGAGVGICNQAAPSP